MGLFDDVFSGSGPKDISKADAFAGILLAANAVDGHISDEEVQGFVTIISRMKMYENWTGNKLTGMIDRMHKLMKRKGMDEYLEMCAQMIPDELTKTVFANCCDLVFADGVVEEEEKDFINKLRKILDIPGDDARNIAQVIAIKNKG
jgi:uncharacterized tellurite resistance protein B-like protein